MYFLLFFVLSDYENQALGKPTWLSYTRLQGFSRRAVDGNHDPLFKFMNEGSCTHTVEDLIPWWIVDLKSTYMISAVQITNVGSTSYCKSYSKLVQLWRRHGLLIQTKRGSLKKREKTKKFRDGKIIIIIFYACR